MKYSKNFFSFTTLLNWNLWSFKDMQKHFLNIEEKNIDMAQNSTQITGIVFFRTKIREKATGSWKLR